jgi:hypothetical protein
MQARGFDRNWRSISKLRIRRPDLFFILAAASFLLGLHFLVKPFLQ